MARRKSPAKMKKAQPSVTRLWFHVNSRNATNYVDLSLAASAVNRRFYRQGTNWAVAGMELHTFGTGGANPSGSFTISKVPDTWVAQNAHTKAKSLWMKSQDQVLDEMPSIKAKYRDYKVFLDSNMVSSTIQPFSTDAAGDGEILIPVDKVNKTHAIGEWVYSTIQLPNDGGSTPPTEITMHMVGDDSGDSRGIIHGYACSRSRPQLFEPNVPSEEGWMNEVFDVAELNEEIREDVVENNDKAPYRVGDANAAAASQDLEFYPGGKTNVPNAAVHSRQFISASTVGGTTYIQGGQFGCGLVRFDFDISDAQDSMYLCIDLVPGHEKGYLTEVY